MPGPLSWTARPTWSPRATAVSSMHRGTLECRNALTKRLTTPSLSVAGDFPAPEGDAIVVGDTQLDGDTFVEASGAAPRDSG